MIRWNMWILFEKRFDVIRASIGKLMNKLIRNDLHNFMMILDQNSHQT